MPRDLGLDPLLFKYGARVNPDLVLDLRCTRIPMVVGMQGDKVQTELFPWYYHPLVTSLSDHPVTKNLDKVQFEFPASIDTIQTASAVRKTVVLQSSEYSRLQLTPVRLSFGILREQPDPEVFNKGPKPLAVLLEGRFTSLFQNRLNAQQEETLRRLNMPFKAEGDSARVLVISDGDFVKNLYNPATEETAPLGFNKYENVTFTGNRDFILNAIEYMSDPTGVLEARAKDVKLRLLDTVKAREESLKWQLVNILGPLAILFAIGAIYMVYRRKRFGRPA
jgi:ABC-2 type transport system permease protein